MPLLPPGTNDQYRGAIVSAWFLTIAGALDFVPGCIHYFLPDGGAGVIAGSRSFRAMAGRLSVCSPWMGALQIPPGGACLSLSVFAIAPWCPWACWLLRRRVV